jgi:lipid-A-disaccharide synthase
LPGSRANEIAQNYTRVIAACERIARAGNVQFVHAAAHGLSAEFFARYARPSIPIKRVENATYNALAAADCAIVASGTATVEAALLGTPMVVVYRVAPVTASILRHMIRTPFIGMVNLIAGRLVAPELIQGDFTPERVATEVRRLLDSLDARDDAKAGLAEVRAKLGPGGAIERAADIFARMM